MTGRAALFAVARREIGAVFHAPIAYVAAVMFLLLQGFSFWALVTVLADPSQPAPIGAVLHDHFGGTFLYWSVLILFVALLSMRLVSEDRRHNTWEALLTAPVTEEAVLLGKWLGGVGFYLILWLPTAMFPVLVAIYAPTPPDLGPIVSAYLGVTLTGMGFLALGLAVSAGTDNQLIAAGITFAMLMLLLLAGQLGDLVPTWMGAHPHIAAVVAHIDIRGHMDALARGDIALPTLAFYVALTLFGLAAAATTAVVGRRRRGEIRRRAAATALVAMSGICINVLCARHPGSWDVSANQVNSLTSDTQNLLAAVDEPVDIVVVAAGLDAFAAVQVEIERVLARMVAAQPRLRVRRLDPVLAPERIEAVAAEFAISVADLAEGGAVIMQRGQRRRALDILDMAGFARDDLGAGRVSALRAEAALTGALAALFDSDRPTVCYSTNHGEMALSEVRGALHWRPLGRRLERDGMRLAAVSGLGTGVPGHCRVLVVAGPERPLAPREAEAVAGFLQKGGRLLLALSERIDPGGTAPMLSATGLELVLATYGVHLPRMVVVDPDNPVQTPEQWLTVTGYGEHPVTSSFRGRRFTLWLRPRAVQVVAAEVPTAAARVLVQSSDQGWGETDVAALERGQLQRDDSDVPGPVSIAAAVEVADTGARMVVFGSARSLSSLVSDRQGGANDLLAAAAIAWLSGRSRVDTSADQTPEQLRLIMTQAQMRQVFVLCVVVMPGAFVLMGTLLWWRRRRG